MKLEIFFDYACPYCMRGHAMLTALLPDFPQFEAVWRPCEAHPRPETYGRHSDLLAMGMLFVRDQGADLAAYHERMYRAAITDRRDIEDLAAVVSLAGDLVDPSALHTALVTGAYQNELTENNRAAWLYHSFSAVPSLVCGGKDLRSVENVGLSPASIREFLTGARG